MDAFGEVSGEDSTALLNLNAHDGRNKVLVLLLSEQLLLAEVVNAHNIANSSHQFSLELIEGIWDVFTRCTVQQFQILSPIRKLVRFDEAEGAASWREGSIESHSAKEIAL